MARRSRHAGVAWAGLRSAMIVRDFLGPPPAAALHQFRLGIRQSDEFQHCLLLN